jgi:stress response protein YsnF
MSFTSSNVTKSGFPMLDMMLQMQQLGLRAMTMYKPVMSAFLDTTKSVEREALAAGFRSAPGFATPGFATTGRTTDVQDTHAAHENREQVVAVGEEVLNVGTRMVPGKTTRVRRIVVETPVQQEVTLHTETVVLEHRKPLLSNGNDVLTEVTVEMSDFNEVPVISKSVRLVEEVLLRKEVTARTETIRDTVKRDTLEIEQPSQLPVVFNAAAKQEEKRRDERRAAEMQDKKPGVTASSAENKPGVQPNDLKRS